MKNTCGVVIFVLLLMIASSCATPEKNQEGEPQTLENSIVIENNAFRLKIDTLNDLNPYSLFDKKNKIVLSDGGYHYGFGRPQQVSMITKEMSDNIRKVSFTGRTDHVMVTHTFLFPEDKDWFEEYLELKNITDSTLRLDQKNLNLRHGFISLIHDSTDNNALNTNWRFLAVPYLINTGSGKREEYKVSDLISGIPHQIASEGWIMTNDSAGFLIIKYAQQQMEYSIINRHFSDHDPTSDDARPNIIWGGSGVHHNDPEAALNFIPNQTLQTGVNRYTSFSGKWEQGFRLFRNFMDDKGHRFPENFNPPVHWNEIYDNPLWWDAPDTPEKRAKYYQLEDMEKEAVKAVEIGCEALYLDPGWDTRMGSTIWADDRLMTCNEFCSLMKEKYNLKVSLHTPLAVWNDESAYPPSARKPFPTNKNYLCSGAPGWWRTKLDRLLKLASDGIVYFMFDGTDYTGPCEVKEHWHAIPYTREEHIRNYARLAQKIKEKFPDVLIEMHDQVLGPTSARYVPTYYTHNANTYDAIWAFEYMWDPMHDLMTKSRSLYYYNLAYNIPLYVHINLKTDNENALVFWWYASTCRYLGIGGRFGVKANPPSVEEKYAHLGIGEKNSPPPGIWEAQKNAMKTYMRLKPFFVRGEFYGIDELTHIHTLPEKNSSVINCFNLEDKNIRKEFSVPIEDMGLESSGKWQITGADKWEINGDELFLSLDIPAMGMSLIEINWVSQ